MRLSAEELKLTWHIATAEAKEIHHLVVFFSSTLGEKVFSGRRCGSSPKRKSRMAIDGDGNLVKKGISSLSS